MCTRQYGHTIVQSKDVREVKGARASRERMKWEHKYPRPDNLQRHVRVHHIDKDKDDPQIRDILAQRPDGPNRGRRRRGPPS
ncbi:hypothetical protein FOYG_17380 [Fusarium oxysporum NRRL 32931]|uniref:Uncharacterized protein n=1 Tax=Fusarium oxysporum NRRL 32931 TaxID=660029 RepID=W9HET2_FUSOX|nr:hypothetical protein FOYG_17380 [Fusarium oxysporum NRRL 32931]